MNIFILSLDVIQCAQAYYDKHVSKIILEIAQMLSTAIRSLNDGISGTKLYAVTHINHPMTRWVRASRGNFVWVVQLARALNEEWCYRYNHRERKHASLLVVEYAYELASDTVFPAEEFTIPPTCVPDKYIRNKSTIEGVINAYRSAYVHDKTHLASWKGRNSPAWWVEIKKTSSVPV